MTMAVLAATATSAVAASTATGGNANVQVGKTVSAASLRPTMTLGFAVDQPTATPGDVLTYTAKVTNTGATLSIAGQLSAEATGATDATVASYDDVVWTGRCPGTTCADHHSNHGHDVAQWLPLAGQAAHTAGYTPTNPAATASGLVLQVTPVPADGVTYPSSGDRIAGTVIGKKKTATWTYTATVTLTPDQAKLFADATKVGEIRNTFRAEVTPRNASAAEPPTVNTEFGQTLFAVGQPGLGTITNTQVTLKQPDGSTKIVDKTMVPALGSIAPGASVTVSTTWAVPVPAPKAATESDPVYLARLAALNNTVLTATAAAAGTALAGPVTAEPGSIATTTTEQLPIVGITKTGPAAADAGDTVAYQVALANTGAATAATLTVTDQVPAGTPASITGAPASLAPAGTGTATATYAVPANQPSGALTDTARVAWTDSHRNTYGPVSAQATTAITARSRAAHLILTPPTAGPNITGTTQTLTATATDQGTQPVAGLTVTFVVTGPNPTTGTALSDATGTATFTYTGTHNGTDTAQATVTAGAAPLTSNTATIGWITPLVPVSTTAVTGTFYAGGYGAFGHQPGDTPAFSQEFPTINFNPPWGTIPHTPPGYNVGVETRPFIDITTDPRGNYAGQTIAQGNGHQAGLGDLAGFDAVFTANLVVAAAGDVTFNFFSDDGFIFGVANGATRVSGSLANPPATGLTPFHAYPVVGAYNGATAPVANSVTVHFPAAGIYPYELDYDECCWGQIALTMAANGTGVPSAGSLSLTPTIPATQTIGQPLPLALQALTATGTPAPGLDVTLTVSGPNSQTVTATTDTAGHVTLPYTGTHPGCDIVLAAANLSGSPTVSNTISVCWDYTPTQPGGSPTATIADATPADGAIVTIPTPVCATITPPAGQTITTWTVTLQSARPGTALVPLGTGTALPPTCPYATIDPTTLPNGDYTVTITATDSGGGVRVLPITIVVDGQLKLGRFTQTFQDMNTPVGGIPIQVTRTYDSFDRANAGDFGNGWRLGVANYRVSANRPLGDGGWTMYTASCTLFCTTGFSTSRPHTVTVTDPAGHQEIFDATPTGGDAVFWEGDMAFTAHPGTATTSKLEVDAGGAHFFYGNDGTLRAGNSAGPLYNPTRFKLTTKTGQILILDQSTGMVSATDRAGNRVSVDANGVHSSNGPSITWTRDGQGRIRTVTGTAGTVTYTYDPNGDLHVVNDFANRDAVFDYFPGHYLNRVTGPGGLVLKKVTYASDGRVDTITDVDGHVTTVHDDPALRTERIDTPDGRGSNATSFDERGNALTVDAVFDGVHHVTEFTYNAHDLAETRTDPNGHTWTAHYDSTDNLDRFVDANGHLTTITPNSFGQPKAITDLTGHAVTFDYDPVTGDVLQVTDPDGHPRTYTYDPGGRVRTAADGVHPASTWTYFPDGKVQSHTNGNGATTTFDYTPAGELFHEFRPDGIVTNSYNAAGQRTGFVDPTGTTAFDIDPLERIRQVTSPQGVIAYGYTDPLHPGQRTTMTTAQGAFGYHYDTGGRLDQVTGPAGTTSLTYDQAGVKTIARPNGVVTTNTYDGSGQLTDIAHTTPISQVAKFHYTLDATGNRVKLDQTVNGQTWTESYGGAACATNPQACLDSLDRLTDVTYGDNGSTTHYDYTPAGNRQGFTITGGPNAGAYAQHYDAAQQLTSVDTPAGTRTLGYDSNGNETDDGQGNRFGFNSQNQMTSATVYSVPHTYGFNADGVRVVVDGTNQLWDQTANLSQLVDDGATTQTYADGTLIAQTAGTVSTFPLADALGSTRLTTDATGKVIATSRYDTFGAPRSTTGPQPTFGYTGQQTDPTGLINLRARMYEPATGRLLSPDATQPNALGTSGWNRYGYVAGNPTSRVDPRGYGEFLEYISLTARRVARVAGPVLTRAVFGCLSAIGLAFFVEDRFIHEQISIDNHIKFECPAMALLFVIIGR